MYVYIYIYIYIANIVNCQDSNPPIYCQDSNCQDSNCQEEIVKTKGTHTKHVSRQTDEERPESSYDIWAGYYLGNLLSCKNRNTKIERTAKIVRMFSNC